MKMPSLSNRASHLHHSSSANLSGSVGSGTDARSAVWTRSSTDDVNLSQLHKFWSELSSAERRELLRIDKQTLFEQVRKNFYCSRCHGLLVEGFAQIMNGKNRHAGLLAYSNGGHGGSRHSFENGSSGAVSAQNDDTRDPSVHSWGGLAATRDNMLTVLDCFLEGTPLEVLQNVFESARTRERERELLYPDACGGGGRGWMSQSICNFGGSGRGHGMKETCALHTARLSCEALVDFWTALGEETRRSLLRMKEEDFIERLMFRFDSKRFCRDCRRNVLREFKEMKELKRTRKEPRCTRWFCAADTVFRYEVSDSMVHVDWRDCFAGDVGTVYQKFEWGLGTAEGKADILGFEDVGLSETVQIDGLDLSNVSSCHITVKGYKRNGLSTELAAKAHALKGQLCVHRRLIVGDGIVSITKGESIERFFERAEETEEEEDDDTMDKDGNELDGEGSRPQKHAKSPELARDFLLDAATVIFKEQVEKAFREGTARQNAHSIFVCLALSLLEERVRVACKEITTLEKQNKLLEEEEDEKREEEERRERRKLKEKEKKLRKKEKLKVKERAKSKIKSEVLSMVVTSNGHPDNMSCATSEEDQDCLLGSQADGDSRVSDSTSARPSSPDMVDARPSGDGSDSDSGSGKSQEGRSQTESIAETLSKRDGNGAFIIEQSKSSRRRSQLRKGLVSEISPSSSVRKCSHPAGDEVGSCCSSRDQPTLTAMDRNAMVGNGKVDTSNHLHSAGLHSAKRHDSWSHANTESPNKHDSHQHCACGSPQNGVRVKVHGQRIIGRAGSKDFGPNKYAERDVISASAPRPGSRSGPDVPCAGGGKCANVELDGLKGKNNGVASTGPGASREQSGRDAELADISMQAHTRSGHVSLSTANGLQEGAASTSQHVLCNGRLASVEPANGHAATHVVPVPGKLVWVSHTMQGPPSLPGPPAMRSLVLSGVGRGATNATVLVKAPGSRPSSGRGRRPNGVTLVPRAPGLAPGPVVPLPTTPPPSAPASSSVTATVSVATDDESTEKTDGPCTSEPATASTPGNQLSNGAHAVLPDSSSISNPKLQLGSSSSHQVPSRTTGTSSKSALTSTLSTLSDPFEPESVRRQALLKNGAGTRNGFTGDTKVLVEANRVRSSAHAGIGSNVLQPMEGSALGRCQHAENKIMVTNGTVLPPGMVLGPPHIHCNGGPPPGNGVRPPMKNMFSGAGEMLQMPCGPAPMPPPMHLHPGQQSYAYYQMPGPWAPRGRNGVLPLPQPGGFLVSGPPGIAMSMGSLPPMSVPMPASLQPLPPGMANPGHFQVPMPNGVNPLHLRENIFLSRYGGRSNGASPLDTRILTSAGMQGMAASQQETMLQEDKKQGSDGGSPGRADAAPFPTSAAMEPEKSTPSAAQQKDSSGTSSSDKAGGSFSLFHFGNGGTASSPADQVLEPESSTHDSSSQKDKLHAVPATTSEPSVPEISRTKRCVDEHAAGTPAGEYSLFAAAPGKGFGFF